MLGLTTVTGSARNGLQQARSGRATPITSGTSETRHLLDVLGAVINVCTHIPSDLHAHA